MNTDRELMQQALEALEFIRRIEQLGMVTDGTAKKAITALRERLAQPEQEPVAYIKTWHKNGEQHADIWHWEVGIELLKDGNHYLYTSPQPAQPAQQQGGGNLPPPLEQQPVACVIDGDLYFHHEIDWEDLAYQGHGVELLYTAPQPRQWQGLTDEEIEGLLPTADGSAEENKVRVEVQPGIWGVEYEEVDAWSLPLVHQAIRAIEAKLREKNA